MYISLVSTINLILNVLCQVLWVWFTKKQPDTPCNNHKKIWIGQLKTKEQQDPFWKKIIFIFCLMRISHTLPLQSVTYHNEFNVFEGTCSILWPLTPALSVEIVEFRGEYQTQTIPVSIFTINCLIWVNFEKKNDQKLFKVKRGESAKTGKKCYVTFPQYSTLIKRVLSIFLI